MSESLDMTTEQLALQERLQAEAVKIRRRVTEQMAKDERLVNSILKAWGL